MSLTTNPTKKEQVIAVLTENIEKGELNHGDRLATVRDMCGYFAVSTSVIQSALREMQESGLIECRGASGFYVKDPKASAPAREKIKPASPEEGEIYLSAMHHSDLLWKRTLSGYEAVRARQIDLLLDYCQRYPEYRFVFDQSEVVRRYLEEFPEKAEEFHQRVQKGQFILTGGMCIPDLNMINGESLVRNLLDGRNYYQTVFGVEPVIASLVDAFGMSAQVPQVLKLAKFRYLLPGRMPGLDKEIAKNKPMRWQGLDGSQIILANPEYFILSEQYRINVPLMQSSAISMAKSVAEVKKSTGDVLAFYMTEANLMEEDLFWIIDSANRNGGRQIKFRDIRDFYVAVDGTEMPVFASEFNPTFSGCYTSRIGTKQRNRRSENLLRLAEFSDALAAGKQDFSSLWHQLNLTQFHDGICGCHTDAVNAELNELFDQVDDGCQHSLRENAARLSSGGLTVFNCDNRRGVEIIEIPADQGIPAGKTVQRSGDKNYFCAEVTPCGFHGLKLIAGNGKPGVKTAERIIRTPFYEADFSQGEPVIRNLKHNNVIGSGIFGEIMLRDDSGSMWTESFHGPYFGKKYQKTELAQIVKGEVFTEAVIHGEVFPDETIPGFGYLKFTKTYIFYHELDYFKLHVELDFGGCNTKVSIRFPVDLNIETAAATYSIPFGSIIRKPYFEVPYELEHTMKYLGLNDYNSAKGDYPALDWVDYGDSKGGLAVANTGTPGHQIVGNHIYVSLLRSGTQRADGAMVPEPGAYDNGTHAYEFACCTHHPSELHKAAELGRKLNLPPLAQIGKRSAKIAAPSSLFHFDTPNVAVSAIFGGTVRLFETLGKAATVQMHTDYELHEISFDGEIIQHLADKTIHFGPFEIKTIKLGENL
jgi:alpha-mannosidase